MASLKVAASSTLDAVVGVAEGITSSINVINQGAHALNKYVEDLRYKQNKTSIVMREQFMSRLLEDTSKEDNDRQEKLDTYFEEKEGRKENYERIYNKYAALFTAEEKK